MDEKDFATIINQTKKIVLSAIEKYLAARFYSSIDDVAQEVYFRAYRSLAKNQFRGEAELSTWLYTIAKNESFRMNKILLREEEKSIKIFDVTKMNETAKVEEITIYNELYEKIDMLPIKYREVLELVAKGISHKEIAKQLFLKSGTVKSRASRGRKILSQMYRGEDHDK